ncbi:hypothetical protein NL676_020017 [Syzygium grande]|nr:hypothetical protein NL676_020017 [Syzygium grande]
MHTIISSRSGGNPAPPCGTPQVKAQQSPGDAVPFSELLRTRKAPPREETALRCPFRLPPPLPPPPPSKPV